MAVGASRVKHFFDRSRNAMQFSRIEASSGVRCGLQTGAASDRRLRLAFPFGQLRRPSARRS
jgi:hypothetical protein